MIDVVGATEVGSEVDGCILRQVSRIASPTAKSMASGWLVVLVSGGIASIAAADARRSSFFPPDAVVAVVAAPAATGKLLAGGGTGCGREALTVDVDADDVAANTGVNESHALEGRFGLRAKVASWAVNERVDGGAVAAVVDGADADDVR